MKGSIKTYLPEQQYGFIKGDDGKDYFFHANEFLNKSHIINICEEALVQFDQQATPKGYKAKKCSLLDSAEVLTYITPSEFYTSKNNEIKGWNKIEDGDWIVHGSSSDSPDHAKDIAKHRAIKLGANAIVDLRYYKTTGEEAGTGKGTHYYTIHNFHGRISTIAKRNSKGVLKKDNLLGANQKAQELKNQYDEQNSFNKRKAITLWGLCILLILGGLGLEKLQLIKLSQLIYGGGITAIIAYTFGRTSDYGYWLQKS
jgi:cold shock CspA family protein